MSTTVEDGDGKNLDRSRLPGVLSRVDCVGVCIPKFCVVDPRTGDLDSGSTFDILGDVTPASERAFCDNSLTSKFPDESSIYPLFNTLTTVLPATSPAFSGSLISTLFHLSIKLVDFCPLAVLSRSILSRS